MHHYIMVKLGVIAHLLYHCFSDYTGGASGAGTHGLHQRHQPGPTGEPNSVSLSHVDRKNQPV